MFGYQSCEEHERSPCASTYLGVEGFMPGMVTSNIATDRAGALAYLIGGNLFLVVMDRS